MRRVSGAGIGASVVGGRPSRCICKGNLTDDQADSQLKLARANWQEAVLSYKQNVQNALEQDSNSLVASQKNRQFRDQQEWLTHAAQKTGQLSEVLYKNGSANYVQVLTSEIFFSLRN